MFVEVFRSRHTARQNQKLNIREIGLVEGSIRGDGDIVCPVTTRSFVMETVCTGI